MELENVDVKYYSLSEVEVGFTTEDIPEGATRITFDTYTTILAQFEANTLASQESFLESS